MSVVLENIRLFVVGKYHVLVRLCQTWSNSPADGRLLTQNIGKYLPKDDDDPHSISSFGKYTC
jgi:hypothetical protein